MEFVMVLACVILTVALNWTVSRSQYSRLERRVNALEQKLFIDSLEFREDIESIRERMNITQCDNEQSEDIEVQMANSKILLTRADEDGDESKALNDFTIIKKTLKSEKQHIRNVLHDMKANVEEVFQKQNETFVEMQSFRHKTETQQKAILDQLKKVANIADVLRTVDQDYERNMTIIQEDMKKLENELIKETDLIQEEVRIINEIYSTKQKELLADMESVKHVSTEVNGVKSRQDNMREVICNLQSGQLYQRSCYYISSELKTWTEACDACKAKGSDLAMIKSDEENRFIVKMAGKFLHYHNDLGLWLGASDQVTEGKWIWESFQYSIDDLYSNFRGMQPSGGRSENCLHIIQRYDWAWNDFDCNKKCGYLCEIQM